MTFRNPFEPIKTSLSFTDLQSLLNQKGSTGPGLRCAWCGHQYTPEDTSPDHDCKPSLYEIGEVQVQPMERPASMIFYMDAEYDPKPVDPDAKDR